MNNSVFGKTMENLRKREDVSLVVDEKKLLKMAAKPTYKKSKIFNENLVAVHKIKVISSGTVMADGVEALMSE